MRTSGFFRLSLFTVSLFVVSLSPLLLKQPLRAEEEAKPTEPSKAGALIETVAEFDATTPPGNIAMTPDGVLLMSLHPFFNPKHRVVRVLDDGTTTPFPNEEWSLPPKKGSSIGLNAVLGIRSDENGIVWMLDRSPGSGRAGRLVAWDTNNDSLHQILYIAGPIIPEKPFLNDLAIDTKNKAIYITDTAGGDDSALIVIDLSTGLQRRVLEGHVSTKPEDTPIEIDGRVLMLGEEKARIGANPITIDPEFKWVYFGPMSGSTLYRVETKDLINQELTAKELGGRVEAHGKKPICDGITVDGEGNVYITDITNNAVGVVGPSGKYTRLYQDPTLLSFPDGMAFSKDNFVYVAVNQLHRSEPLNQGKNESQPPFYIVRFKALAPGAAGR